jgi:hypothetical protein
MMDCWTDQTIESSRYQARKKESQKARMHGNKNAWKGKKESKNDLQIE